MGVAGRYDVAVIGGGPAGCCAALASAKRGARTLLVDSSPIPGGNLLTGMSIDGAVDARGGYIAGGVARQLFDACAGLGGLIGPVNDFRLISYVCLDPEVAKIALARLLARHGVTLLSNTMTDEVMVRDGRVESVTIVNKQGRGPVEADWFVDCSGDADIAARAGAPYELGDDSATLQPLSLMFRMSGVEKGPLLSFVRAAPGNCALGESQVIRAGRSDAELAAALESQGRAAVFFKAGGPLLDAAIARGDLFPTALVMITPVSEARKEVCVNATRIARNIDGTKPADLGGVLAELMEQVLLCSRFLKAEVPGFGTASISGLGPHVGVRETRRILGDATLTGDDVRFARTRHDGIAKGCHHIDIHGAGTAQVRIPVEGGGHYDIPLGSLLPIGLENLIVAGRSLSSTRDANGSARVMGTCMSMGEAAGTAAAMCLEGRLASFRELSVEDLRAALTRNLP